MTRRRMTAVVVSLLSFSVYGSSASAVDLTVVSVSPAAGDLSAPVNAAIVIEFDRPVLQGSVDSQSFSAFGRWSGVASGTYSFSNGDQTVTLTPDAPFSAGERVMVVLSHDLEATDTNKLRSAGYTYQFWIVAAPAPMTFTEHQVLSTRAFPTESAVTYGGVGSDFDNDGHLDLGMVLEDSADFRVFMNKADGSGLFQSPFLSPPTALGVEASPNEPADFNRDGIVDLCVGVASTVPPRVSVLIGNGDGTFQPQQIINVGSGPYGVAVLDMDGDGDMDIANTNMSHNGTGTVSTLENDGNGVFGAPVHIEAGANEERGLAAADMNNDGIPDLVVGTRNTEKIIVMLGNGNGTFTPQAPVDAGGSVWMLTTGDINNDGNEDVVCANSGDIDGSSVLLGDGAGGVALHQTIMHTQVGTGDDAAAADRANAVDLADWDGDGQLEWFVSSFGGVFWRLFENDGTGTFTLHKHWTAPEHGACAIGLDIDNDLDLDLVMIEETADLIFVMRNEPAGPGGSDKIYWTDRGFDKIQRASPSILSPNVEDLVTSGLSTTFGIALDLDGGKMYWVDAGIDKIQRADLDGTNVEDLLTVGLLNPFGIALDIAAGRMYWTDYGTVKIQRAGMDIPGGQTAATRTDVVDLVDTGLNTPFAIALDLDAGKMYFSDGGLDKIQRANLDGTSVEDVITVGSSNTWGIALDTNAGHIYWTDTVLDKIQRADMNGVDQNAVDLVVTGLNSAGGIALDLNTDRMYWVDSGTDKVQRAGLDGSNVTDMLSSGLNQPTGIALDVPTPAQPVAPAVSAWAVALLILFMTAGGMVMLRRTSAAKG